MEEESVTAIRETSRNILKLNRRFHRDEEADNRRHMANISITPQTIEEIVNRLKTKSPISINELHTLKNGFMEESKCTEIVLNTHGALRGLVRELTGRDVNKQCAAAGCFCNLGLADSRAGATVAKAAGMYLVTALDSLTTDLAVTCAWAVGNLAGSGSKASELLVAQGALAKLCDLLLNTSEELRDAALYALVHIAYQMKDGLSVEHLQKITEALSKLDTSIASCHLLFILSCHSDFPEELPENYLQKLLMDMPISMQSHFSLCHSTCDKECKLLYLIRILANTKVNDKIHTMFLESFSQIVDSFKMLLLKDDGIGRSVMWLLGNLYNFNNKHVFFNVLLK